MGDSTFEKLVVALNPSKYGDLEPDKLKELKEILKENDLINGVIEAGKKKIKIVPKPLTSHKLTFQTDQSDELGKIYYWILDFIQDGGWETKKIIDNFMASAGSGQFTETMQKMGNFQTMVTKTSGDLNVVLKSVLNLIYDLKDFEERLSNYTRYHSKNEKERNDAMLALKQIWLDNVDMKKGRGAIHAMSATDMGFTTLREVFMIAKNADDVRKMNADEKGGLINDQVMRIVIPRIDEFLKWVELSEKELSKRFEIEKSYLKGQIEAVKLYSSWLKPYIKATEELKQQGFSGNAALVNALSTSLFQLTLLGKKTQKDLGNFEKGASKKQKDSLRKYHPILMIDIKYRGHVSQKATQRGDYAFVAGGRIDMTFDSYVLNNEELKLVEEELAKEDVLDGMKFSMNLAEDSLKSLEDDLNHFLKSEEQLEKEKKEKEDKEKKEKKKSSQDIDILGALTSLFRGITFNPFGGKKKKESAKIKSASDIKPDNFIEKEIRTAAEKSAMDGLYLVYDIYKKSHGMASSP